MKSGVVSCFIIGEHMVHSLGISDQDGGDGMGPVSQRPAFPVGYMLKGAQEYLNFIISGELAEKVLGVSWWVGERSSECRCQLLGGLLIELALLQVGFKKMLDDGVRLEAP